MTSGTPSDGPEPAFPPGFLPGSRPPRAPERAIKPGRHGLSAEEVAEIQRERILDAFVAVTAQEGYAALTISKVTDAAGVTKKAFYVYFADLEECFLAAYEHGTGKVMVLMTEAYDATPTWVEGIRAGLRVLLKVLAAERPFARTAIVEVYAAGPRLRAARNTFLQGFRAFFTDEKYGLPAAPKTVIDAIVGGIHDSLYLTIEEGRTEELPDLLPSLTYFALLPLLGRDEALEQLEGTGPHAAHGQGDR
jgi:AcrR family transcriptional regulator